MDEVHINSKEFHINALEHIADELDDCNIIDAALDIDDFSRSLTMGADRREITSEDYAELKSRTRNLIRLARGRCICSKKFNNSKLTTNTISESRS